jgi:N-hydroxyarylamine O-acetyltransferase
MQIEPYLQRINYAGPLAIDVETLHALHRAHLFAVPFENLDIHLKRPIILDEQRFYDKIVNHGRGGFCYEQNGLFAAMLRGIGFAVDMLEARVAASNWETGTPFDHMTLVVHLEERWLADVGFGDSFIDPLRLDHPGDQQQPNGAFRVIHDGTSGVQSRQTKTGDWRDEYLFRLEPRQLIDFDPGLQHNQYSPNSHFTQQRVCSLATPTGRITLSDRRFIVTETGQRTEHMLENEAEFQRLLREKFGIDL